MRDPDGNSLEAVHHGEPREGENRLDHLWIRVRDLAESRLFYETVAPTVGLRVQRRRRAPLPRHERRAARSRSCRTSRVTENLHLAFPASDRATVEAFHRAAARGRLPRQRRAGRAPASTTPVYYGAFVLDPDGNNIEAVFHDRSAA